MTQPAAHRPADPDLPEDCTDDNGPSARREPRAVHLRPSLLLLVFVGGAAGTAVRAAVGLAVPSSGDLPWTTAAINVVGAFLLGVLVGWLGHGPDHGRRRTLRMLLGTGFLGGFTTYSTLALDGASLVAAGLPGTAVAYGLGTVVLGALAAWAGITTASRGERA